MASLEPPGRIKRGVSSPDVRIRRENVVRLRAYATSDADTRFQTKRLL